MKWWPILLNITKYFTLMWPNALGYQLYDIWTVLIKFNMDKNEIMTHIVKYHNILQPYATRWTWFKFMFEFIDSGLRGQGSSNRLYSRRHPVMAMAGDGDGFNLSIRDLSQSTKRRRLQWVTIWARVFPFSTFPSNLKRNLNRIQTHFNDSK